MDLAPTPPAPVRPPAGPPGARRGRRLAVLPAAALLLPLLILGANAWAGWHAAWRNATTEMVRTADAGAEYATRVLAGYAFALGRIVDLVRGLPDAEIIAREAELHAELRRLLTDLPQAEAGFVVDRDGFPLLAANVFPVPRATATAADRDFFLALSAADPPRLHVSQVYRSRFDGKPFFALSRRREGGYPPGQFDGLANVSVFPETIGAGLGALLREPGDALTLATAAGVMIGRTGGLADDPERPLRPLADGDDRDLLADVVSVVDGRRQMLARSRVAGFPLFVAARRRHDAILAAWWRDQRAALLLGLPTSLALFLLSLRVQRAGARLATANDRLGAALRESESWLRRTTEGAGIGTWESRADGPAVFASTQFHRLLGLGSHGGPLEVARLQALIPPAGRQALTALLATARRTGRARSEIPVLRPRPGLAPEPAWLAVEAHCATPGDAAAGPMARPVVGIAYDITARRAAEDRVALLLRRTVEQQEAERLRIARDLHDRLGQHLALLQWELAGLDGDAAPAARIARLRAIGQELGAEAGRLAIEIRPTAIDDLGLGTALRQLVEDWGARTGLRAELHLRLPDQRLPLPVETTLYRILQEALTNVLKHAGAGRVGITMDGIARPLRMVIEDDGRGMPAPADPDAPPAFGLRGIGERLALLGGSLEVESAPGRGTTLLIEVPL